MTMPDLIGRLRVQPGLPPPAALHSGRRAWAGELARGQTAAVLPGLLASLFNLCGHAHRLCAEGALAAAQPGRQPAPAGVAARLRRDTAAEHVRRIALDWPRLLADGDAGVASAALAGLRTCPLLGPRDAHDPTLWPDTLAWLEQGWLQMPATRWHRAWQVCGADWWLDWSHRQTGWLPALVSAARSADTGEPLDQTRALRVHGSDAGLVALAADLDHQPGFVLAPLWQGAGAHTGPWARRHGADADLPLTPWSLLGSRVAELVRLCLPDGDGQGARVLQHGGLHLGPDDGLAWVEMARGLLVHRVRLHGDGADSRVQACQVLAPTEWNFQPQGEVAHRVAALDARAPGVARQVGLLMAAFDPCVPFEIGGAAQPRTEVCHA